MLVYLLLSLAIVAGTAYPELNCDGPNEVATKCTSLCPQFCNISYTEYKCDEKCKPGCDCKKDYLRNRDGECVHTDLCESPYIIPQCDKDEVAVPCIAACPKTLCQLLPMFEYLCTKEKKAAGGGDEDFEDEDEFIYECPLSYDPNNIPAIFVSNLESTIIGIDFPHPTKYKRPELVAVERSETYFAPFILNDDKEEIEEKKRDV